MLVAHITTLSYLIEKNVSLCTYYSGWMLCLISFNELCRAMRNREGEKNENLCLQRVSNSNPLGFRKIIQCPRLLGHRTKIYVWMCFKSLQYHRIRFILTLVWQNIQRIYYGLICSCKVVNTVIYDIYICLRNADFVWHSVPMHY